MVDGPGPRAIGNDFPIVPLVAGPVWDALQIADHHDIWIVSTKPNPDCEIRIAFIDLECTNGILLTANICHAVRHMVRDSKTLGIEGNVNTNRGVRIILVINRRGLASRNGDGIVEGIVFVRETLLSMCHGDAYQRAGDGKASNQSFAHTTACYGNTLSRQYLTLETCATPR